MIYYISPTEEELFLKYNPDLQKRSLENRAQKEQDFDNFVMKLREYSKSDKPSELVLLCRGRELMMLKFGKLLRKKRRKLEKEKLRSRRN